MKIGPKMAALPVKPPKMDIKNVCSQKLLKPVPNKMLQIIGSIANSCYQMQGTWHLIVLHLQILLLCYIIELCPDGNNGYFGLCGALPLRCFRAQLSTSSRTELFETVAVIFQ